MTRPEFAEWLRAATTALGEHVVLFRGPQEALEHWNYTDEALLAATRVYLTGGAPDLERLRSDEIVPGRLGWLQLDVPRADNMCLMAIRIAAKSDWFDAVQDRVMENPVSLRRFDRFWRTWKVRLRFPVRAKNVKTGAEGTYPMIGYSAGAAEWVRGGGTLRQQGVANIEFVLPGPTEH